MLYEVTTPPAVPPTSSLNQLDIETLILVASVVIAAVALANLVVLIVKMVRGRKRKRRPRSRTDDNLDE